MLISGLEQSPHDGCVPGDEPGSFVLAQQVMLRYPVYNGILLKNPVRLTDQWAGFFRVLQYANLTDVTTTG